ncbi:hypothetical protein UFOVP660_8 [uncultured Caudovirales phage]|uniref:Major tail protein n=1 Tax=uncultured Caudovirales phage TaxID=2100421 RepID=A0A6J5N9M9_9CAUD|nr:hypothetical protein UFOVP660_8 [uncultured Caudovirales phage]
MTRIKGKSIVFKVGTTDFAGAVKSVTFKSAPGEIGFGDYADSLDYTCEVTGFQDFAASSLWTQLFANPGATLQIEFAPHGNAVASATQPHFTASGYAESVPDFGGAAGEYFTYDLTIKLDGKPVKVVS